MLSCPATGRTSISVTTEAADERWCRISAEGIADLLRVIKRRLVSKLQHQVVDGLVTIVAVQEQVVRLLDNQGVLEGMRFPFGETVIIEAEQKGLGKK